jgi:type I restriction enzyme, S subunit
MTDIKQLITEHIDIWTAADTEKKSGRGRSSGNAGSVYGVKKLRDLILELAVRGKLVPQDQNDEPAIELLKRIQAEKAKLIAEGKLKKEKPLVPITEDEKPFELPNGWEFVRLETISDINGGFAFKSTSYTEDGVRVIRISDFDEKGLKDDKIVRYKYSSDLEQYRLASKNILMAMTGGTVGKCYLVKELVEDMVVNQRVATIKLMSLVLPEYISNVLQTSSVQSVIQEAKNSTNDNISMLDIKEFFIPIPSLAEQHRIVAKVDELMALCDQLEQQHSNAQDAHETLVSQLLATLTQSQNAAEFNANWQRISAHFDVLFTTEASIDALKQTLLQLAVMGKLVPQDPNDEPASELLKRIQAEKAKLIAEGKLKKAKPLAPIGEDEKPFKLPNGWEWARFPELGEFARGKSKHRPRNDPFLFNPPIYPLVQTGEVARAGYVIEEYHSKYSEIGLLQSRMWAQGTLCITIAANIADSAILGFDACFPDSVVGFSPSNVINSAKYFLYFMKTARDDLLKFAPATAQKNINLEILESVLIPTPPLAEQHRIVAKVDDLMALFDQLKTRIQQANQQQQTIADALVAQAVA